MMNSITQIKKTGLGQTLMMIWGLTLIILIGLPLSGFLQHELSGYLAFAILTGSALIELSIIISYKVESGSIQIARGGWVGLGFLILVLTLYLFDGKPNSDIAVFLGWSMIVHSFPGSLLVALIDAGLSYLLGNSIPAITNVNYIHLFIVWLVYFIAGYFQWFKLIPFIIEKLRHK